MRRVYSIQAHAVLQLLMNISLFGVGYHVGANGWNPLKYIAIYLLFNILAWLVASIKEVA